MAAENEDAKAESGRCMGIYEIMTKLGKRICTIAVASWDVPENLSDDKIISVFRSL
jgi:hypothetical protein